MEVQIWHTQSASWLWLDCSAKIVSVHHGLHIGMVCGVIVLQENGCLLLCSDSGSSSLQPCENHGWVVWADGLCRFYQTQKGHPFLSYPKRQCTALCTLRMFHELFLQQRILMSAHHGLWLLWLWLVVVTPRFIAVTDVIQETFTLSPIWVQLFLANLHTVFFLFLCRYSWNPSAVKFAALHHWYIFFQHSEANVHLCIQFPGRNPLIWADARINDC